MIEYINIEGFGGISAAHRAIRDFNIQAATSIGWGGKARVERKTKKLVAFTTRINQSTHTDEQTDKDAFWQAVMVFQRDNGITKDGKLGAATWRKLLLVSGLPDEKAIIKWSGLRKDGPGTTAPPQKLPAVHNQPPADSTLPIYTTPPLTLPNPPAPEMPMTPPSLRPPDAPAEVIPGKPPQELTDKITAEEQARSKAENAAGPWYKRVNVLIGGGIGVAVLAAIGGVVLYRKRNGGLGNLGSWYNPKERMSLQKASQQFNFIKDNIKKKMGPRYHATKIMFERYGIKAEAHLGGSLNPKIDLEIMRVISEIEDELNGGNYDINCDLEALYALGHTL